MYRQARLNAWRRKKPMIGQTYAKRSRCQADHSHRSGLEARVCDELRLRKIAGASDPNGILDYDIEFRVRIQMGGFGWNHYVDFRTHDLDGGFTFVEAKGIKTPEWRRNWGCLQEMHKGDPMVRFQLIER